MAFVTPLRYPGGKGRLGHWLSDVLAMNNLQDAEYVEPYAGGAGAAVFLLVNGHVGKIHINDIDPLISGFWSALVQSPKKLANRVRKAELTLAARDEAKQIIRNAEKAEPLDVAYSMFLLNRTSRSGILRGGPIGGRSQNGKYKLDARFNREGLADRIEQIGRHRRSITVTQWDALDLLSSLPKRGRRFVYCDPPYFVKGSQLYRNYYKDSDHVRIANTLESVRAPWLVTYDCHPRIKDIYTGTDSLTFNLQYSTHLTRPEAKEILFYKNVKLPCPPYLHR